MAYLTLTKFKLLSTMPTEYIDEIETAHPGFVEAQLESVSKLDIDSRLRKRYAAPFEAPYPDAVEGWLARLVTPLCWERRGFDPTDQSMIRADEKRAEAKAEIKEAADSNEGLWDLPLRADTTSSGVSRGGPYVYSEQSPYVGFDLQRDTGRDEDFNGSGTQS